MSNKSAPHDYLGHLAEAYLSIEKAETLQHVADATVDRIDTVLTILGSILANSVRREARKSVVKQLSSVDESITTSVH